MPKIRLDKFLRDQGVAARSEIKEFIKGSRVTVNERIERDPGFHVEAEKDKVSVDGEPVEYRQFVYYMLNKPRGIITATEDKTLETVLDLFPETIRRREVFPVGRLDRDTEGLLIITDNGAFAHDLLSPRKHVKKLYEAGLDCFPGTESVKMFEDGVILQDGYKALPASLEFLSVQWPVIARIEVYEGRFHQVKRMFRAVGAEVLSLKRLRMGDVWLDKNLRPGEFRELTGQEIALLGG